jgi:hypothetical protein
MSNFIHQVDGHSLQTFCLQYGLLQTFLFNKSAMHAMACFVNREDAASACAHLGRIPFAAGSAPLCQAEVVLPDQAMQLINSQPNSWSQLSISAGLSSVAPPPNKSHGGGAAAGPTNIWGDSM